MQPSMWSTTLCCLARACAWQFHAEHVCLAFFLADSLVLVFKWGHADPGQWRNSLAFPLYSWMVAQHGVR